MRNRIIIVFAILFVGVCFWAYAADNVITGKHKTEGLTCADCHDTDKPEKRAPASACINCHGDMTDSAPVKFKDANGTAYEVSPHNSHAGQMRCTICHAAHKPSTLYCNEGCHHSFDLKVP